MNAPATGWSAMPAVEIPSRSCRISSIFATTHWTAIERVRDPNTDRSRVDLAELCQTYWTPLYGFLRGKGLGHEDSQDLTQAFLVDFLSRNLFARADRQRGRFRSFLATSLENFLHNEWRRRSALKRGSGQEPLPWEAAHWEETAVRPSPGATSPAEAFDRQWAQALLDGALRDLLAEWNRAGRTELARELLIHLWGEAQAVPYASLCARFDLTPVNLRVIFHRFRTRYRELLQEAVAKTVMDPAEIDDELRFLWRVVSQ